MSDIFAPEGGWRVRILDLSASPDDNITEEVGGFFTLMQANEFARRYVRDSVEICRAPGMKPTDVLSAWFTFGEDAQVVDGGEASFSSAASVRDFAEQPAREEDRDWRALDPRNDDHDDEDDDDAPDEDDA